MGQDPMTDQEARQLRRACAKFAERLDRTPPSRAGDALRALAALLDRQGPWPTLPDARALVQLIEEDMARDADASRTEG